MLYLKKIESQKDEWTPVTDRELTETLKMLLLTATAAAVEYVSKTLAERSVSRINSARFVFVSDDLKIAREKNVIILETPFIQMRMRGAAFNASVMMSNIPDGPFQSSAAFKLIGENIPKLVPQ